MNIDYRTMNLNETSTVLNLLAEEIPAWAEIDAQHFTIDPHRAERTFVAVRADGEIISAVRYMLRHIRDAIGEARKVGAVSGVATRKDARGQGHAAKLLELALAAMQAEGCDWSLLFTEVNPFYERLGWKTFATGYRQGMLSQQPAVDPGQYRVQPFRVEASADGWAPLAAIYDAFNAHRPLTTVRDTAHWQEFSGQRLSAPSAEIFAATCGDVPCGYIVAHFSPQGVGVSEIGVLPGDENALLVMLDKVRTEALARGALGARVYIPRTAEINSALECFFAGMESGEHFMLMGKPVAEGFTMAQVEAIFTAPGAISWPADDF